MFVFYLCHILSSPLSLPFWPHIWKVQEAWMLPSLELVGNSLPTWEFLPWACTLTAIKTPSQCLYVLSQFILDLLLSYPTISRKPYFFFFPPWPGQLVGSQVRDQRWSLGPLQWKHGVLTTGPSGIPQKASLCK